MQGFGRLMFKEQIMGWIIDVENQKKDDFTLIGKPINWNIYELNSCV